MKSIVFSLMVFFSILSYCQDYDCFEFESIPSKGIHFFAEIRFLSQVMIVKSSFYLDKFTDEEKIQLKRIEIEKIKKRISKSGIFYVPDSTMRGYDGLLIRIKFIRKDAIVKESFAWGKYINESYFDVYKCISRIVLKHSKNVELRSYLKQRIDERK